LGEFAFVEPDEFRSRMVAEIPKLAAFLDSALRLEDKVPLGFEVSHQDLELPLLEDRSGPGDGVLLVADPVKYVSTGLSTSPYDRTLHFWITDEEALRLSSEISQPWGKDQVPNDRESNHWPLLSKVAAAKYGGLVVLPGQVSSLESEAADLKSKTKSTSLREALERISSVCRSAQNYRLGLYVYGE
jgi:hypothetical protein